MDNQVNYGFDIYQQTEKIRIFETLLRDFTNNDTSLLYTFAYVVDHFAS